MSRGEKSKAHIIDEVWTCKRGYKKQGGRKIYLTWNKKIAG